MLMIILCILFIIGILSLIFLQTHKLFIIRSLGIFIVLAGIVWFQTIITFKFIYLLIIITLAIWALLSDTFTAILRTWAFKSCLTAYWGGIIGGFIGLLVSYIFKSFLLGFIIGTLLGAFIGEFKDGINYTFSDLLKKTLGTFTGFFGMGIKLLMALTMIEVFFLG